VGKQFGGSKGFRGIVYNVTNMFFIGLLCAI